MRFLSLEEIMAESMRVERQPRYDIRGLDVRILARANGMRFNCFWLKILNISRSGLLIYTDSDAFITFRQGDELQTTLDIAGKLFQRPIHGRLKIVRVDQSPSFSAWGLEIVEIERRHYDVFNQGICQVEATQYCNPPIFAC